MWSHTRTYTHAHTHTRTHKFHVHVIDIKWPWLQSKRVTHNHTSFIRVSGHYPRESPYVPRANCTAQRSKQDPDRRREGGLGMRGQRIRESRHMQHLDFTCSPSGFLTNRVRTGTLRHHSFSRDERESDSCTVGSCTADI